jgi:hypothetical protein
VLASGARALRSDVDDVIACPCPGLGIEYARSKSSIGGTSPSGC